jgi:hypothetical protein
VTRWPRGEAEIEGLLASDQLQSVSGGQANGQSLLSRAKRTLETAAAIEVAIRAQFGPGFRVFGAMRRRRNELEYPVVPDEATDLTEAQEAVDDAHELIRAAEQLLTGLSLFR